MNNSVIVFQRFVSGLPPRWRSDDLSKDTSEEKGTVTRKTWSLADYPSLFLTFANLNSANKNEILGFAERYGMLGDDWDYSSLVDWQRQIEAMKGAIKLWKAWKLRHRKSLAPMIWWDRKDEQDIVRYRIGDAFGIWGSSELTDSPLGPDEIKGVRKGDLETAGMLVLRKIIGLGLNEAVIDLRPVDGHLRLCFVPLNLAGALWLQFALAVAGNHDYRSCEYCGKPFIVAPEANRTNRRYCKDSCKTLACRKRKKGQKRTVLLLGGRKVRLLKGSSHITITRRHSVGKKKRLL